MISPLQSVLESIVALLGTQSPGDPELPQDGHAKWFKVGNQMEAVREGSRVQELVDGPAAFVEMYKAMLAPRSAEHFIYLLGWWATDNCPLLGDKPSFTLHNLLKHQADRGVEIRVMLWDGEDNKKVVDHINELGDSAAAILDGETRKRSGVKVGSHHQKLLVVKSDKGLVAYCGGVDFNPDRILPVGNYAGFEVTSAGAPLNDVHIRVEGPSAYDLLRIFVERWVDHPDLATVDGSQQGLIGEALIAESTANPPRELPGSTLRCQVGRTYPRGIHPRREGVQQCAQMVLHAIQASTKFIYIEEQYFVPTQPARATDLDVMEALRLASERIPVIVLLPDDTITPLPGKFGLASQTTYRRNLLIQGIRGNAETVATNAENGCGFYVFHPVPAGNPKTYIHSKTWVFDDEFAIVGSANCNRRSWTHDSECSIGIWDRGKADGSKRRFPHHLRMRLWAKYLKQDFEDMADGLSTITNSFLKPGGLPASLRERNYADPVRPGMDSDFIWDGTDPDGSA